MRLVEKFIPFGSKRRELTLDYIRVHYDPRANEISIDPTVIVIHWTASCSLQRVYAIFKGDAISLRRWRLRREGKVNVSAQFVVDRDGTSYQLMPANWMARHTIGLNWTAIGIENVGGPRCPLTAEQLATNAELVVYLHEKFPGIRYLIGHHEYLAFRGTELWKGRSEQYVTQKIDPGSQFMEDLRRQLGELGVQLLATPSGG